MPIFDERIFDDRIFDSVRKVSDSVGLLINTVMNATIGAFYVINCWWEEYTP